MQSDLRSRFETKTNAELQAVLNAAEGEYTPAAITAAQAVLDSRVDRLEESPAYEFERSTENSVHAARWFGSAVLLWIGWITACLSIAALLSLHLDVLFLSVGFMAIAAACLFFAKLLNPGWHLLLRKIATIVTLLFILRAAATIIGTASFGGGYPIAVSVISAVGLVVLLLVRPRGAMPAA